MKNATITIFLMLVALATCAHGAELLVPSQYPTIQLAINAAVNGDTVIVAPGTYTGTGNREIDFLGKAITVRSENGPENCIIDCNNKGLGFRFSNGENANSVLVGFTITNSYSSVYCRNSSPMITDCTITGNAGGIYCGNSNPTITGCTITGNADGGIFCDNSSPTIISCTITGNTGGNIGGDGGGISCGNSSSPTITNCIITGNTASGDGGGIYCYKSNPMITSCIITGNTASGHDSPGGYGGGIYCYESNPMITSCTIAGNTASGYNGCGGGISCGSSSRPKISNSIFWNNTAQTKAEIYGGADVTYSDVQGGYLGYGNINAAPLLTGDGHLQAGSPCINAGDPDFLTEPGQVDVDGQPRIMGGRIDIGADEVTSPVVSAIILSSKKVIFDVNGGGYNPPQQILSIRNLREDSMSWEVTEDCPWLEVYPSSGSSTDEPNYVTLGVDAAGLTSGIYNCTITIFSPSAGNSPRTVDITFYNNLEMLLVPIEYPTIQSAINAAVNGDTVLVADGIYTGTGNYNIDFLRKAITVRSENGPESCIIDCDGLGLGFYFYRGEKANSVLDGFTITNGSNGAILCGSNPTITNCIISGNTGMDGGGIRCSTLSHPIIVNCVITGNSANYGGGIYCDSSNPTIASCTITGNTAGGYGGGIYCLNDSSPTITNSIIAGNSAKRDGGGIYGGSSNLKFTSCTIAGNSAGGNGGGLFRCKGQITNCIISNNTASAYSQLYDSVEPTYSCIQDWTGTGTGNIAADPCFAAPGDYHLLFNSPCIDAGNPLYTVLGKTDIDGQPRVIGTCIDMGADEYGKMIVVTGPVQGEIWATGSKRKIEWTQFGVTSVDILLSKDAGENWQTIAEGITDANSYLWKLPNRIDSNQCVISVLPSDGDANVISIDSELFTIKPYPHRPPVPRGWQHWGRLPGPDLSDNKGPQLGCVKWIFDTNGPVSSQVAVTRPGHHGYGIYVGCEDGFVYAINDDGELLWSRDINTPIVGSPAVGYYGMVYVAGQNGWIYAIDDDGDVRWTQTTDAPIYSAPVVGCSGKIYVSSEDGLIYAFDADGSDLWTFETKGPAKLNGAILTTPVIERNGAVYVSGFYDPNLYALDANTGSVNWACLFASADDTNTMAARLFAAPAVGPDGTIYQTLIDDPNLYAIDPCTGNIIWTTSLRLDPNTYSSIWSPPAVGHDGTIYVSFDDPYLRAVNPDGTIKWMTRLGMVGGFTLTIDKKGFIYAASDDGYVCVVNPEGEEVSRFKGDGWVSFPAIAEDGTLIVSDSNNRVWAISAKGCGGQPPALHRPADVQPNWAVDFMDFALLANNWLQCTDPDDESCGGGISGDITYAPGDIDRDLYVDYLDIAEVADNWLTETDKCVKKNTPWRGRTNHRYHRFIGR